MPQVLRLMHQRCQVIYISHDSDALLSSLVVVDCAWFMKTIVSATSEAARSQGAVVDANKLVRSLFTDNYADGSVQMGKLSSAHSLVVHWLLAAFQSLQVSIQYKFCPRLKLKLNDIAPHDKSSQSYEPSLAIWYHNFLPATRHKRTRPA